MNPNNLLFSPIAAAYEIAAKITLTSVQPPKRSAALRQFVLKLPMTTHRDYIKRDIRRGAPVKECREWLRKRRELTGSRHDLHSPKAVNLDGISIRCGVTLSCDI